MGLDELSGRRDDAKYAHRADDGVGSGGGRRVDAEHFLGGNNHGGLSRCLHSIGGEKQIVRGPAQTSQAVDGDPGHDSARFDDGDTSRQEPVAKFRSVCVVVDGIAPGDF